MENVFNRKIASNTLIRFIYAALCLYMCSISLLFAKWNQVWNLLESGEKKSRRSSGGFRKLSDFGISSSRLTGSGCLV